MLIALCGLGLIAFWGCLLLRLLRPESVWLECLGLGYIIGLGLFTFFWFLLNFLGIPYTLLSGAVLLLVMLVLTIFVLRIKKRPFFKASINLKTLMKDFKSLKKIEKIWIICFILFGIWMVCYTSYWPAKDWDSIVLYDFRAKMFYFNGAMDQLIPESYLYGYPLLTSLAHTIVYFLNFPYPGIIHGLFYLSFLSIFFANVRKNSPLFWALFWTSVCAFGSGLADHATMTYTNLAYTVYFVSGIFYLAEWLGNKKEGSFWIAAILIGLSTWTRNAEPFWLLALIIAVLVAILRKRLKLAISFVFITRVFSFFWNRFVATHYHKVQSLAEGTKEVAQLSNKLFMTFVSMFKFETLPAVFEYFYLYVLKPSWQIFFVFVLSSILLFRFYRKTKKITEYMWICLICWLSIFITFFGIYYFSVRFKEWRNIGGSATRMTLFMSPLVIYFASGVTGMFVNKETIPVKLKKRKK